MSALLILNGELATSKKGVTNKYELFESNDKYLGEDIKLKYPLVFALLQNQTDLIQYIPLVFNSVFANKRRMPREYTL